MVKKELLRKVKDKKAVLCDLDGTFYAYPPCHAGALRLAWACYRGRVEPVPFRVFLRGYEKAKAVIHQRLEGRASAHSRLLYFQTLIEQRRGMTDFRNALILEKVYWDAFLKRMRIRSWARPFLKQCKSNGVRVAVVTNLTAAIQLRKIERLGLGRWVDFLVSSEEAGTEKPAPGIFRLALKKVRCRASEALAVGDEPGLDAMKGMDFVAV